MKSKMDWEEKFYTDEAMDKILGAADNRMKEAVGIVHSQTQKILVGKRSGRWYGSHQASAPGEPPAKWTGDLKASVETETGREGGNVVGYIGTKSDYARPLEYGSTRILPRPWLKKSYDNVHQQIVSLFAKAWFS